VKALPQIYIGEMLVNNMKKRKKGFSLVEVLIALAVFTMGIISVLGAFPLIYESIGKNETNVKISLLGQYYMDRMLIRENWVPTAAVEVTTLPETFAGVFDPALEVKVKYWGATPVQTTPKTGYQNVFVEVTYKYKNLTRTHKISGILHPGS
jgi:prepilin-type N-terminal cleavage/methylation domain-containing protein